MQRQLQYCLWLAMLTARIDTSQASLGDRHPTYQACLRQCTANGCIVHVQDGWRSQECNTLCKGATDRWLQLFRWDCEVRPSHMFVDLLIQFWALHKRTCALLVFVHALIALRKAHYTVCTRQDGHISLFAPRF